MNQNRQDELHDLAAAYALDALTPEERRSFEEHLRGCEACRAEVAELAETASALAYGAEPAEPPPRLRESILEAARAEQPNVVPLRTRWTPRWVAAVAAAAAVALGLGLWATLGTGGGGGGTKVYALKGADATLSVGSSGHAFMSVKQIAPAPRGKSYEIWVIPPHGKPLPSGLFARAGTVSVTRDVPSGATVAVTLERAEGAESPTSQPFASVAVD
jgi:anti-sigma-K factor RskA